MRRSIRAETEGAPPALNPWEALTVIAAGKVRPFYLLHGTETFLMAEVVAALRQQLVVAETEAFNYHAFDWGPGRLAQVLDVAQTLPFLVQHRLVVLRDCPLFGRKGKDTDRAARVDPDATGESETEDDQPEPATAAAATHVARSGRGRAGDSGADEEASLTAYLERPAPFSCLVITAGTVDSRRRLFKTARSAGEVLECRALSEEEAVGWSQRRASGLGNALDGVTARQLVARAGTDLHRLAAELEKLALYAAERRGIRLEDVDALVSGTAPGEIFDLLDAVGRRRVGDALTLLHKFLRRGDPGPVILAAVARHLRMLILARAFAARGTSPDQAAAARGQHPFYWKKLTEQARNFERAELVGSMAALLQADLALKSGQETAQVLQAVVLDLGNRKRPATQRAPALH